MSFFWNSYLLLFHDCNVQNRIVGVDAADHVMAFDDFTKNGMPTVQVRLRKLRDKELGTGRILATVCHGDDSRFVLEVVLFVIDGVTGTARSIPVRITALDHESLDDTVESETIIKALVCKVDKVRDGVRSGLEVQVHHNLPLVSCYFGKNLGNSRIILVKDFSLGKSICDKEQRDADNKFFKQNLTSVVISF